MPGYIGGTWGDTRLFRKGFEANIEESLLNSGYEKRTFDKANGDIFRKYAIDFETFFIEKEEVKDSNGDIVERKETVIFSRYHQLQVVK